MRQVKKMITENCKLYFQTEKGELIPADRVRSFPDATTSVVDAECSFPTDLTIEMECKASATTDPYALEELFATEAERRFNKQCRRDLHRWFRENEPFINDLADDISAANRNNFKIFKNRR